MRLSTLIISASTALANVVSGLPGNTTKHDHLWNHGHHHGPIALAAPRPTPGENVHITVIKATFVTICPTGLTTTTTSITSPIPASVTSSVKPIMITKPEFCEGCGSSGKVVTLTVPVELPGNNEGGFFLTGSSAGTASLTWIATGTGPAATGTGTGVIKPVATSSATLSRRPSRSRSRSPRPSPSSTERTTFLGGQPSGVVTTIVLGTGTGTSITLTPIGTGTGAVPSVPVSSAKWSNSTISSRRPPWRPTWRPLSSRAPSSSLRPTGAIGTGTAITRSPIGTGIGSIRPISSSSVKWSNSISFSRRPTWRPTGWRPSSSLRPTGTGTGGPIRSPSSVRWLNSTVLSIPTPVSVRPTGIIGTGTGTAPIVTFRPTGTGTGSAVIGSSGIYITTTTTLTVQLPDQTITRTIDETTTVKTATTVITLPPGATITHFTTRRFTVPCEGPDCSVPTTVSTAVASSREVVSFPSPSGGVSATETWAGVEGKVTTLTSYTTVTIPRATITQVLTGEKVEVTAPVTNVSVEKTKVVTMTVTPTAAAQAACTNVPRPRFWDWFGQGR